MKCAEIHPNLAAFALGGLEPEEAAEVRRHLASCPGCQKELEEIETVRHSLEAAPPPAAPPVYLKDEILSRVRAEGLSRIREESKESSSSVERGSPAAPGFNRFKNLRIILPSVAAAAVVAMVTLGVFFGFMREELPVATIQLVPTPDEAAGLKGYWGVAEIRPQPSGNQQVELKLNNFEEPKPNSYYELWFVSGETKVLLNVPPEARNYHTLLITEEHMDNDTAPSQEVALKGEMP
jgi:hypothetical protein